MTKMSQILCAIIAVPIIVSCAQENGKIETSVTHGNPSNHLHCVSKNEHYTYSSRVMRYENGQDIVVFITRNKDGEKFPQITTKLDNLSVFKSIIKNGLDKGSVYYLARLSEGRKFAVQLTGGNPSDIFKLAIYHEERPGHVLNAWCDINLG